VIVVKQYELSNISAISRREQVTFNEMMMMSTLG